MERALTGVTVENCSGTCWKDKDYTVHRGVATKGIRNQVEVRTTHVTGQGTDHQSVEVNAVAQKELRESVIVPGWLYSRFQVTVGEVEGAAGGGIGMVGASGNIRANATALRLTLEFDFGSDTDNPSGRLGGELTFLSGGLHLGYVLGNSGLVDGMAADGGAGLSLVGLTVHGEGNLPSSDTLGLTHPLGAHKNIRLNGTAGLNGGLGVAGDIGIRHDVLGQRAHVSAGTGTKTGLETPKTISVGGDVSLGRMRPTSELTGLLDQTHETGESLRAAPERNITHR